MNYLHRFLGDARFALRLLRRNPSFSATVLGLLAVGIGATTAMFSLVVSLLVRPLPYADPDQLTVIHTRQPVVDPSATSLPDFLDWEAEATTFDSMAAITYESFGLSSPGDKPESVDGAAVTGNFFSVYRVAPLRGRLFDPSDDRIGGPRIAVISADLWHRRFASDPAVVGRSLVLNAEIYTVVGIAQEGFRFSSPDTSRTDVWAPIAVARRTYAADRANDHRGSHFLNVVGRRKPGVSLSQAGAQLDAIAKTLSTRYPDENAFVRVGVVDLHDAIVGPTRDGVLILFAAVGLVFLVMCANVGNLLLARASSRRAEMATRAALGATRGRLMVQLVTETLIMFLVGGVLGAALAHWLVRFFAEGLERGAGVASIGVHVDGYALGFAIAVSLLCGIVFGLVPAAEAARLDPQTVLKETAARASIGPVQRAIRGGLVVVQVALALALLAGGGLALRAFSTLASTPVGFDANGLVSALIALPDIKYADDAKIVAFQRDVIARLAAQPGVTAAAGNTQLPMSGSNSNSNFSIEGQPPPRPGAEPTIEQNLITPGYFRTMGIPLLRGREFTEADAHGTRSVMVISKLVADKYFPGEDPIGHRLAWGTTTPNAETTWFEIVGVAGDVRRRGLADPIVAESYALAAQIPTRWLNIVARSAQPERVLQDIPAVVAAVDPDQAVTVRRLMSERVADTIGSQRFATKLLGAFAAAALLLATLGIFGLVSYTTGQRTRELGIRIALGSSPERVVAIVMGEGVRLLAVGLAVGLVGAVFVGRALAGRLDGAVPFDVVVFASIFGVLALAGLLASLLPALRAVRIPPSVSLRYE